MIKCTEAGAHRNQERSGENQHLILPSVIVVFVARIIGRLRLKSSMSKVNFLRT